MLLSGSIRIMVSIRFSVWLVSGYAHVLLSIFIVTLPVAVAPHLHLTTSKVMVIVWRLRGNIFSELFYIGNVLPLQWAQLTETVHTARLGHEFVFVFFGLHDLSSCSCVFCFTLVS